MAGGPAAPEAAVQRGHSNQRSLQDDRRWRRRALERHQTKAVSCHTRQLNPTAGVPSAPVEARP